MWYPCMEKKSQEECVKKRNEKGFTLIELIAVLMILGIMSATAMPKMQNLVTLAEEKALQGGLAAGLSTVKLEYARLALENSVPPSSAEVAARCNVNRPASREFEYQFAVLDESRVQVVSSWAPGTGRSGTTSKVFGLP